MEASENELNKKILELTTLIQQKYPELYIHIGELTDTLTTKEHPEANIKTLSKYYESLKSMTKKYIEEKDKNELHILNKF